MIYRGYKVLYAARVYETWDFVVEGGMYYLKTLVSRIDPSMEATDEHFTIETPKGKRLYEYPDTLRKAKAFIDRRIKQYDALFHSDCHQSSVQRSSDEDARFYICTTCHQPCKAVNKYAGKGALQ